MGVALAEQLNKQQGISGKTGNLSAQALNPVEN